MARFSVWHREFRKRIEAVADPREADPIDLILSGGDPTKPVRSQNRVGVGLIGVGRVGSGLVHGLSGVGDGSRVV